MLISTRRLLLAASLVVAAIGVVLWLTEYAGHPAAAAVTLIGLIGLVVLSVLPSPKHAPLRESDNIIEIGEKRRQELFRGTSLFLREMRYRYSVRLDTSQSSDRRCFCAEVNTVRLGFVPAFITDNTNERQGLGYVAFVFDGDRWRGPGLPCPADQVEAVHHAARCVSPLAKEEETHFEVNA